MKKLAFLVISTFLLLMMPQTAAANTVIRITAPVHQTFTGEFRNDELAEALTPSGDLGLKVFQTDNRITYVWNSITSSWDIDNSGLSKEGNENFIPIFGIDNSLQNSIIYNTRVLSLTVPSGTPPKYRGKVAINNEDPKGTLHINSINDVSTSVPLIFDNRDSFSIISRNFNNENNTVFKSSIGSVNVKLDSNSFILTSSLESIAENVFPKS
jgi:hypothetical protein